MLKNIIAAFFLLSLLVSIFNRSEEKQKENLVQSKVSFINENYIVDKDFCYEVKLLSGKAYRSNKAESVWDLSDWHYDRVVLTNTEPYKIKLDIMKDMVINSVARIANHKTGVTQKEFEQSYVDECMNKQIKDVYQVARLSKSYVNR